MKRSNPSSIGNRLWLWPAVVKLLALTAVTPTPRLDTGTGVRRFVEGAVPELASKVAAPGERRLAPNSNRPIIRHIRTSFARNHRYVGAGAGSSDRLLIARG